VIRNAAELRRFAEEDSGQKQAISPAALNEEPPKYGKE
jgi:hypothetical protein